MWDVFLIPHVISLWLKRGIASFYPPKFLEAKGVEIVSKRPPLYSSLFVMVKTISRDSICLVDRQVTTFVPVSMQGSFQNDGHDSEF